jgi:deazaflavin-dependent oxidoreductase (nitroreductase family)
MTKTFQMTRVMRIGTAMLKAMLRAGVPMGPLVLLAVRGRKSGTAYTTPVALVKQNGTCWLVAAFGEVNWVHNLRAAGEAQLIHGYHLEPFGVVELGVTEAAPILQQFLKDFHRVPFIPPYFNVTQKSPLTDFEREALHHPVFRIISTKAT